MLVVDGIVVTTGNGKSFDGGIVFGFELGDPLLGVLEIMGDASGETLRLLQG